MSRRRFRERLPFTPKHETHFHWRGRSVSRLEGFSDAVFGFALTLLVVAIEVPRSFGELARVLRDFPSFVVCFLLLMYFWNEHYRFFRRYGLEDTFTRLVNYGILLFVLFSVYPLKFLFSSWLGASADDMITTRAEISTVYRIYGFGFACIWSLYAVLHWHALRRGKDLQLTPTEVVLTRAELTGFLIQVAVCLLSINLSHLTQSTWLPGVIYSILGPLMAMNFTWYGRAVRRLTA